MSFTVGGVDVAAVHVGPTAAEAVYLGADQVWPTGPPKGLRDVILSYNPVAYWPLDPADPTADVSGNGHTLAPADPARPPQPDGGVGGWPAMHFDGTWHYETAANFNAHLAPLDEYTQLAFVRNDAGGKNRAPFGRWMNTGTPQHRTVLLRSQNASNYQLYWMDHTAQIGAVNIPGDQLVPHLLTVVLERHVGGLGSYNNQVTSTAHSNLIHTGDVTASMDVGAGSTSGAVWIGGICHVAVLPVALTPSQISDISALAAAGP